MKALESQAWAAAHKPEWIFFKERRALTVVRQLARIKILVTLTRLEYKRDNGDFFQMQGSHVRKRGSAGCWRKFEGN